jgi:outer membrane murein-binding lipoprotein Lpp
VTPLELASRLLEAKLANRNTLTLAGEVVRLSGVEAALRAEVESFAANWKLCEAENDRLRLEVEAGDMGIAADDGTAQREIERLSVGIERMRSVVDAAERWAARSDVHDETVMDAVRQYRQVKP